MGSFFKTQIQAKENPVGAEYERLLVKEMVDDAANWNWAAKGYKIYPSGLRFSMCPYQFIRARHIHSGISDEKGKRRTEKGRAIHAMLQAQLVKSPKIVFRQMCFTNLYTVQELHEKLQADLCEIPIRDIFSGVSGKADLPPWRLDSKRLACIDIKSTTKPRIQFEKLQIPIDYRTQLAVYAHLWNRDGYWPEPVNTLGILYYNDGEDCSVGLDKFREVYIPFTPKLNKQAADLLFHLAWERFMLLYGMDSECTYKGCKEHHGGSDE